MKFGSEDYCTHSPRPCRARAAAAGARRAWCSARARCRRRAGAARARAHVRARARRGARGARRPARATRRRSPRRRLTTDGFLPVRFHQILSIKFRVSEWNKYRVKIYFYRAGPHIKNIETGRTIKADLILKNRPPHPAMGVAVVVRLTLRLQTAF